MNIDCVEIRNFRRLGAVRIDLSQSTTLLVGANNSGKTSAVLALHRFLDNRGASNFTMHDIPLDKWEAINELGHYYIKGDSPDAPSQWSDLLPSIDIWLNVAASEIHHVSSFLPTLSWEPQDGLGVRLQLEPVDSETLQKDYLSAHKLASDALEHTEEALQEGFTLWPASLTDFLKKHISKSKYFKTNAYLLDPDQKQNPESGTALPQSLPPSSTSLDFNPLIDLVQIDVIWPQQDPNSKINNDDSTPKLQERLSSQLNRYYKKHLDPEVGVDSTDVRILEAIHSAQEAFDKKLEEGFKSPLTELENLGYPGVTEPRVKLSTQIKPTDGLHHDSAVQYEVVSADKMPSACRLPEHCNGLGYQNLISMVFHLLSFRDARLKVGKAALQNLPPKPIHLVLLEEPEAHLHAQVQQVFIRKAHKILNPDNGELSSQLIVSTHSSHIAHEVDFKNLRYFRRRPAGACREIPSTTVTNLTEIFGTPDKTAKFQKRYLKATHADLFFADGVILVEGAAERILVPHFIKNHCKSLEANYLSLLEINGSHSHRLLPLIQALGIDTLIITDLDSVLDRTSVAPERELNIKTSNYLLKNILPKKEMIDDLLDLEPEEKEIKTDGFAIRVSYQTPVATTQGNEIIPRTFEDALAISNTEFFKSVENGLGLIEKFKTVIEEHETSAQLGKELHEALKNGNKANFALDLLFSDDPNKVLPPSYIKEGLEWLEKRLNLRQKLNNSLCEEEAKADD